MYRGFRILATIALAMGLLGFAIPKAATTQASTAETYVILYNQQAVPSDAATMVANAGGTFVYGYDKIGLVMVAQRRLLKATQIINR